jgi:hypothetical protein
MPLTINKPQAFNPLGAIQQGLALREQREMAPMRQEEAGLQLQGTRDTARVQSIVDGAKQLKLINSPQGKLDFLLQRRNQLQTSGLPTNDTDEAIQLAQSGNFEQLEAVTDQAINFGRQFTGGGATAEQRNRAGLLRDLQSSNPDVAESAKVGLGLAGRALGAKIVDLGGGFKGIVDPQSKEFTPITRNGQPVTPEDVAQFKQQSKRAEAIGTGTGEGVAGRIQNRIEIGTDAAAGLPRLKRLIELSKTVETGGLDAISLDVRRRLGLETADEGEFLAGLGRNVLSQLRPIFGAAFTAKEGDKLDRIEAGVFKSPAANRRLLNELFQSAQEHARVAIDDALKSGDTQTAKAIMDAMSFEFDPDDLSAFGVEPEEVQPAAQAAPQAQQPIAPGGEPPPQLPQGPSFSGFKILSID